MVKKKSMLKVVSQESISLKEVLLEEKNQLVLDVITLSKNF